MCVEIIDWLFVGCASPYKNERCNQAVWSRLAFHRSLPTYVSDIHLRATYGAKWPRSERRTPLEKTAGIAVSDSFCWLIPVGISKVTTAVCMCCVLQCCAGRRCEQQKRIQMCPAGPSRLSCKSLTNKNNKQKCENETWNRVYLAVSTMITAMLRCVI